MIYLAYYKDNDVTHLVAKENISKTDTNYVKIKEDLYNKILNAMSSGFQVVIQNKHISILENKQTDEYQQLQELKNKARSLLDKSMILESGVYQRKMNDEQQSEFVMWQDVLAEFIHGERQEMPPTPDFINQLLERL